MATDPRSRLDGIWPLILVLSLIHVVAIAAQAILSLFCVSTASVYAHGEYVYAHMCAREIFVLECSFLSICPPCLLHVTARLMHKLTIITSAPCPPILSPVYCFSAFVSDLDTTGEDKDNLLKDSRYLCPNPETLNPVVPRP